MVADIAPRVAGYWGDSCNTLVIGGEPSAEQVRVRAAAQAASRRPRVTPAGHHRRGVRRRCARRSGRGRWRRLPASLGPRHRHLGAREPAPRAGRSHLLVPGMVIMCEPATYLPGVASARLEWMFLVTESGNEVLTDFEHRIA